jgi:hypothetical protein
MRAIRTAKSKLEKEKNGKSWDLESKKRMVVITQ